MSVNRWKYFILEFWSPCCSVTGLPSMYPWLNWNNINIKPEFQSSVWVRVNQRTTMTKKGNSSMIIRHILGDSWEVRFHLCYLQCHNRPILWLVYNENVSNKLYEWMPLFFLFKMNECLPFDIRRVTWGTITPE